MKPLTIVAVVLFIIVALIFAPSLMNSIDDARTDEQADTFLGATVADHSTSVTLTKPLFDNNVLNISTITCDDGTAYGSTYTSGSRTLVIAGLGAISPQDIVVTYSIDANPSTPGITIGFGAMPFVLIAVLAIAAIVAIAFAVMKR